MPKLKKIKAETLIETLAASVIISIVFAIALSVIVNIEKFSNNRKKLKAYLYSEKIINETKQQRTYFDETYTTDDIKIIKTIGNYTENEKLKVMEVVVYDGRNKYFSRKFIIENE